MSAPETTRADTAALRAVTAADLKLVSVFALWALAFGLLPALAYRFLGS